MTGSRGILGIQSAETGFRRGVMRLRRLGITLATRSAIAVEGVTITSDRRAAMRTIGVLTLDSLRSEGWRFDHSSSVRKSRREEAQIIERDTSASRRDIQLPAEQPCRINPPERSYEADILASGAGQVLVQLHPETAGTSDGATRGVHEHGCGHELSLISRVAGT
jgi:hypothetical protein